MKTTHIKHYKHHGVKAVQFLIIFFSATVLFLWGWNSAMPFVFNAPHIQFKEALGLLIVIGIISLFLRGSRKHSVTHPHHQRHHDALEE